MFKLTLIRGKEEQAIEKPFVSYESAKMFQTMAFMADRSITGAEIVEVRGVDRLC